MSKVEVFKRLNEIVIMLRKGPATLLEINDYLAMKSELLQLDLCRDKRTFFRDCQDILTIYQISIEYNRSSHAYSINEDNLTDLLERKLEAFDILHALNIHANTAPYIHLEKRRPQGTRNLFPLLNAIKNRYQVRFSYQGYWADAPFDRLVNPMALKEFKNRWYLIVKELNEEARIKCFALDRFKNLTILKKKIPHYQPFDCQAHFKNCFGIISPNEEAPHEIILSFDAYQGNYIKSLPLHTTQEILVDNAQELKIKLTLFITVDLVIELLSFGNKVKVLQPLKLVEEVREAYQKAEGMYN